MSQQNSYKQNNYKKNNYKQNSYRQNSYKDTRNTGNKETRFKRNVEEKDNSGINKESKARGRILCGICSETTHSNLLGGKINFAKSEVMRIQVKYLGFVVSKDGILMDLKYRQALVEFPPLKSPKALVRFLGMVQYYKHFLKDLSKDSANLHKLKIQTFMEMPPWVIKEFERIKQS